MIFLLAVEGSRLRGARGRGEIEWSGRPKGRRGRRVEERGQHIKQQTGTHADHSSPCLRHYCTPLTTHTTIRV